MEIRKLEKRVEEIKGKLARIGEMRPGSINEQLTVCGNSSCRCADPKRPRKHGPYYQGRRLRALPASRFTKSPLLCWNR